MHVPLEWKGASSSTCATIHPLPSEVGPSPTWAWDTFTVCSHLLLLGYNVLLLVYLLEAQLLPISICTLTCTWWHVVLCSCFRDAILGAWCFFFIYPNTQIMPKSYATSADALQYNNNFGDDIWSMCTHLKMYVHKPMPTLQWPGSWKRDAQYFSTGSNLLWLRFHEAYYCWLLLFSFRRTVNTNARRGSLHATETQKTYDYILELQGGVV